MAGRGRNLGLHIWRGCSASECAGAVIYPNLPERQWPLSKGGALAGMLLWRRKEQRGWRDSRCPGVQEGKLSARPGQQQQEDTDPAARHRAGGSAGAGAAPEKQAGGQAVNKNQHAPYCSPYCSLPPPLLRSVPRTSGRSK